MTQNASPNLFSRHIPLLTEAGGGFYSILGWLKKRRTTRSSGLRRLRAWRESLGNLRCFKSVSSLNLYPVSSHAGSCPPSSGRFQPQRRQHSQAREGDIMTGHHDSGMCLPPPCHILPPGHWFSFLFVCFLVFLFLPRRKSGTFARLRGLKFFKLPSL